MPEKIAFFVPNFSGGGAERVIVNLANHFSSDFDVHILCISDKGPYLKLINDSVTVAVLPCSMTILSSFKIYGYLKKHNIKVILSTLRTPNIAVGAFKKFTKLYFDFSWIAREANTFNIQELTIKHRLINLLCKYSYRNADLIISNSEDTKSSIINFLGLEPHRISVVPNPVIPKKDVISKEGSNRNTLKIINVGRLVEQKNQKELIKIAHYLIEEYKFKDFIINIYGEGCLKSELDYLIEKYKVENHVKIHNFTTTIMDEYSKNDLLLLVSTWEGFGNVLVEALAKGLPIFSYSCPGGPSYIINNSKVGLLFDYGDIESVCINLLKYHNREIYFDDLSIRNRALDFSIENISSIYLRHIEKLSENFNK